MKNKNSDIEQHWKDYLPIKYVRKFPIKPVPVIKNTVKSTQHQTDSYRVERFYKFISKIH